MSETLNFKPYARLLTMLGDQLITNERVALVEIIKNAYDADADWVKVRITPPCSAAAPPASSPQDS